MGNPFQELLIAEKFLPAQLNEEDIKIIVLKTIQELNASQMSDMGRVMKNVLDKTKGMADGKIISNLVRENLG